MNNIVQLPRLWLDEKITSHSDFLKAMVYLAREINNKGSVEFSSGDARLRFGMSPRRYRTFMSLITNDKLTDKKATSKTTVITFDLRIVDTPTREVRRKTSGKERPKFSPPTDEEVCLYVAEKGYHFDPAQFVSFYQSKGWQVGNQPMKDWKAACRTWETSWVQKHGNNFYNQINNVKAQFDSRRGTDVGNRTERDYGGPF